MFCMTDIFIYAVCERCSGPMGSALDSGFFFCGLRGVAGGRGHAVPWSRSLALLFVLWQDA